MAKRKFSYAYERFVPNPNSEVIGLIAYSLYKRDKAAEIKRQTEEGKGEPTEDELYSWSKHNSTDTRVEEYKVLARGVLEIMIRKEVTEVCEPRLRKAIGEETIGLIRTDLNKLIGNPGFWGGVFTSIGGAVIWVVVSAAIVYINTGMLPWAQRNYVPDPPPPQTRLEQESAM